MRRPRFTWLLVARFTAVAVTGVFVLAFLAIRSEPLRQSTSPVPLPQAMPPTPGSGPKLPQEMFAPYWTLEPGWDSELELRNNLPFASLTVRPVLRTPAGAEVELSPVTLAPNEVRDVDLRESVAQVAPSLIEYATWRTWRWAICAPGN